MAVMQSNTPAVKNNRKRGLIVMVGGVAVAVGAAMMSGTGWLPKESATVAQPVQTVNNDNLSIGDALTFAQSFGDVVLTVRSIDGDMVTVVDAEGDAMTVSAEALSGSTLQASDADRNAADMLETVKRRAASGYYERHAGQNGAWGD